MARARVVSVSLMVVMTAWVATAAAPARATPTAAGAERIFVAKINAERARHQLPALVVDGQLVEVARRHSRAMAASGRIWHNQRLRAEVVRWVTLGENVGSGAGVDDLHRAFMASPSHRVNVLYRTDNRIGVGVVVSSGVLYVTEVFARRTASASTRSLRPLGLGSRGEGLDAARAVAVLTRVLALDDPNRDTL